MEVPECPPTPPILTEGLSSPKAGPASPVPPPTETITKEASSPSRSGSPEPNCPICLGTLNNKSYSDSCFHKFCFKCLLEWSKVKAECPLCKQKFKSIIHNVKSMEEYDQYTVQPPAQPEASQAAERLLMVTMDPWAMSPWFVRRHHTVRRHSHLPQTVRRTGNALIQLFDMIPRAQNTRAARTLREERHALRETQRQALREARGRLHNSGIELRRSVYRTNLWAQPLADVTGRYREYSLAFYKRNPAMTHRLLPWLSRDLSVLCEAAHIAVALERINGLLVRHDMRSPQFSQDIREFLGENTRHFMHELISFARSPFDMLGYDREVTHDAWYPGLDDHTVTFADNNSSSEDDIMEVPFSPRPLPVLRGNVFSPRTPSPEAGPSRLFDRLPTPPVMNPRVPESPLVIDSSTDDETPRSAPTEEASVSDVEVVAVLKPKHERTPEIVDLLSDSDAAPASPVHTVQLGEPWDPEQASTSHVSIECSTLLNPEEAGPSTSYGGVNFSSSTMPSSEVKSEEEVPTYHLRLNRVQPLNMFDFLSDSDSFELPVERKPKHKKSKKKSKRRIHSSSSESDSDGRSRRRIKCACKSCDKEVCTDKTKKRKKSKSHKHRNRSSSSSPRRSKVTKRTFNWTSSDESDTTSKRPKLSSKVVWQIRKSSPSDEVPEYQQPRIRSIVVKRQAVVESPHSSSSQQRFNQSDSESSWEPSGRPHKKCKSKGKGKGKGKRKAE